MLEVHRTLTEVTVGKQVRYRLGKDMAACYYLVYWLSEAEHLRAPK
jgi:hypothetical protein